MKHISVSKWSATTRLPALRKPLSVNLSIMIALAWLSGVPVSGQDPNFHIYLGIGQANMAGAGTIEAQDKTVDSRFQAMAPDDCSGLNRTLGK